MFLVSFHVVNLVIIITISFIPLFRVEKIAIMQFFIWLGKKNASLICSFAFSTNGDETSTAGCKIELIGPFRVTFQPLAQSMYHMSVAQTTERDWNRKSTPDFVLLQRRTSRLIILLIAGVFPYCVWWEMARQHISRSCFWTRYF